MTTNKPVYVLLYHPWMDGFEACFDAHLSWLRDHRFKSIRLSDLVRYMRGEKVRVPEHPVAITLDDGSIESLTMAYPQLKKYGFFGTVFVPTAKRYISVSGSDWWERVEGEGILEIEGHSHSHGLVFVNDQVEDFYIPRKHGREPILKGLDRRSGAPIFGLGYELVSRRFFPEYDLMDLCVEYVREQKGPFFRRRDWKENLLDLVSKYPKERGRYETEQGKRKRIEEELRRSKSVIERTIGGGKKVQFFAYPFGAYNADLIEQVKQAGYAGALTTDPGGNSKGDDPFAIKRMTISDKNSFGGLSRLLGPIL